MLVLFAYQHVYELAAFCLLMIVLIIVDYFKQGTLVLAAKYFHHKDYEKAEAFAETDQKT